MQTIKRHKFLVTVTLLLSTILVFSIVVFAQNIPRILSPTPTPSPAYSPTQTPIHSTPTSTIPPNPSLTALPTHIFTFPPPSPTYIIYLYPGEVTQYSGINLTPILTYSQYIIEHPDVAIAGAQYIDNETYRLSITGLVDNAQSYTYPEVVENFNSTLQVATLPCVEGWSVTMLWQGVKIMDLLQQAGVMSSANTLIFFASDGYSSSLPLQYISQNNIMIAYKMNNVTLTPQLGYPFFLVAQNQYGYKWVEWITSIEVSDNSNYLGYWESRGYPNDATVQNFSGVPEMLHDNPVSISIAVSLIIFLVVGGVLIFSQRSKKTSYQSDPIRFIDGKKSFDGNVVI